MRVKTREEVIEEMKDARPPDPKIMKDDTKYPKCGPCRKEKTGKANATPNERGYCDWKIQRPCKRCIKHNRACVISQVVDAAASKAEGNRIEQELATREGRAPRRHQRIRTYGLPSYFATSRGRPRVRFPGLEDDYDFRDLNDLDDLDEDEGGDGGNYDAGQGGVADDEDDDDADNGADNDPKELDRVRKGGASRKRQRSRSPPARPPKKRKGPQDQAEDSDKLICPFCSKEYKHEGHLRNHIHRDHPEHDADQVVTRQSPRLEPPEVLSPGRNVVQRSQSQDELDFMQNLRIDPSLSAEISPFTLVPSPTHQVDPQLQDSSPALTPSPTSSSSRPFQGSPEMRQNSVREDRSQGSEGDPWDHQPSPFEEAVQEAEMQRVQQELDSYAALGQDPFASPFQDGPVPVTMLGFPTREYPPNYAFGGDPCNEGKDEQGTFCMKTPTKPCDCGPLHQKGENELSRLLWYVCNPCHVEEDVEHAAGYRDLLEANKGPICESCESAYKSQLGNHFSDFKIQRHPCRCQMQLRSWLCKHHRMFAARDIAVTGKLMTDWRIQRWGTFGACFECDGPLDRAENSSAWKCKACQERVVEMGPPEREPLMIAAAA